MLSLPTFGTPPTGAPQAMDVQKEGTTSDVLTSDQPLTTESLHPRTDPWGLIVLGSPAGIGPLCGEAGRLGFELFRTRALTPADSERLLAADWAAAVVVEDGNDLDATTSLVDRYLGPSAPIVWVGKTAPAIGTRTVDHLAPSSPSELIAALTFDRVRQHLYPDPLVSTIQGQFQQVLRELGEASTCGPVWVKNHFTPPFSLTVAIDLYGDVSGELAVSASEDWFRKQHPDQTTSSDIDPAHRMANYVAAALLTDLVGYFEGRGADLSTGPATFVDGGRPVCRRLSHRTCVVYGVRDGRRRPGRCRVLRLGTRAAGLAPTAAGYPIRI